MNKKLIALAVAAASVAPAAMAQTANPVTLYGRIYVMFESVEAKGGANPIARRNRVTDNSSLLGVRGTEDLGGGLKAFFQLEMAFRPDDNQNGAQDRANANSTTALTAASVTQNNSPFSGRNSGVGLQGGWGSILLGRWDTPYKTTTTAVDPFGDLTIGGITGINNDGQNHDRRANNVVQYWSPTFAGFAVRASYAANEGKTASLNPSESSASLTWGNGPVYLFYAYEQIKDVSATLTKDEANSVGGSFVIGPFKLGGLYGEYKKTGLTKKKSYMLNGVWTIGNHQLIYQYQDAQDGGASGAEQPEASSNTFGYQYNFSKRTFFLAQYVKVDNNNTAGSLYGNFGANRLPITAGQDPQGFAAGFRHVF
jgi:predicted porin